MKYDSLRALVNRAREANVKISELVIRDEMEEMGIVGPFKGSKPREILITKEQWQAMQGGQPTQMEFDDFPVEDNDSVPEELN